MKIDKGNPLHWLLLLAFGAQCALALLMRCLRRARRQRSGIVVLYGRRLNGNLSAVYRQIMRSGKDKLRPVYVSMDLGYLRELRSEGIAVCWAASWRCAALLSSAEALISSHGLHSLELFCSPYQRLGMKLFDVWHGMTAMEYRPQDVVTRKKYDEIWVASGFYKQVYTKRFEFEEKRVFSTGHARTDRLIDRSIGSTYSLRRRYGLPLDRKLVLFAPTWKNLSRSHSIFPFGCEQDEFLESVDRVVARSGGCLVVRPHVNSGVIDVESNGLYSLPAAQFPDTEEILAACDVLVSDWSTIVFDWLLLDRPAIFLDVEPPYPVGGFLGEEFRYGEIVGSLPDLLETLTKALTNPAEYWRKRKEIHDAAKAKYYGEMADGKATSRCVERLMSHLRD